MADPRGHCDARSACPARHAGITLALFATTFNVIGVLLMLSLTVPMMRFLERRFVSREEDLARPRHLDGILLEVPTLTLRGLVLEAQRPGRLPLQLAADGAERVPQAMEGLRRHGEALTTLADRIREHGGRMNRSLLPRDLADALAPFRLNQAREDAHDAAR